MYGAGRGLDSIRKANQKLQEIAGLDASALQPLVDQMESAFFQLEDAAFQLRDYRDGVEFNPERLDHIEQRLDLIRNLRRKYGDTVEEILAYLGGIVKELDLIDNKDERIHKLQMALTDEQERLVTAAADLSNKRKNLATELSAEIEHELRGLQMERTRLEVRVMAHEDPNGIEADGKKVRFTKDGWTMWNS